MQSLLGSVFALHANRTAVQGRAITWTYAELDRLSADLAQALIDRGIGPGSALPILMGRSPLLLLAQVALLRLGGTYSPIDMGSPPARQRAMLDAIGGSLLLTDGARSAPEGSEAAVFNVAAWLRTRAAASAPRAHDLWIAPPADCPVYVMFTSGSTGTPKGVMVPHSGIVRLVHDANYAHFGPEQRWGFLSSPAFDLATLEVWGALLNGGCCVVQEDALPSLDTLGDFLVAQRITDTWLTSALFNVMVEDQLAAMGGLRQLLVGGERVSPQHARRMLQAHPNVRLINGYGPTENTTFTLCHTISLADTEAEAGVPIGTPLNGTQVRVDPLDAGGEQQSDRGELWTAGDGVALGYLGDAELTQRKFVWHGGARWYRTGDMVRERADGVFEFHGRIDRQIKLRGHRIELESVELALARCPGVGTAAVLVVGDSADQRRIVAVYSLLDADAADAPDEATIAEHLRHSLPEPAMPSEYVCLATLPANLNGKVDRAALARLLDASQRGPSDARADSAATLNGEFETALASIWRDLLPHAAIARDAHFLRIGGTSLLALHVAAKVHKLMRRNLPPMEVLRHPVLADQARLIAQLPLLADRGEVRDESGLQHVALTHVQQNLLAASRLDPTGHAYLVHVALHLPAAAAASRAPDTSAWRLAFEQLALRHPALRLLAYHDGVNARGTLKPALAPGWWQDHAPLAAAPRDLDWPPALMAAINRPLDTRTEGSMRVDAFPLVSGGSLLVWTLHHHVVDEASIDIGLAELDALLRGETLQPVYGSPFAFQAVEASWTDRRSVGKWAATLVEALAGSTPPLERPPAPGRELPFALTPALQQQLRARCEALGCTPFTPLLSAYGLALQDVFGPRFRFVSTPFSRRVEPELIEPIGYLVDTRFVEAGARPAETPSMTLSRVHEAILQGQEPAFQWLDVLTEAVAEVDSMAAQCLTQFFFTWRLNPARSLTMAGQPAQLLRVPQAGARYAMCLHAAELGDTTMYSIEAVDSAHSAGQVTAVARAFEARLAQLCAATEPILRRPAAAVMAIDASPATAATNPALVAAWSRWLNVPEASVKPTSHFLRSGGSSLTAMRMAAHLRRQHGLRLDVGAFLGDPSFAKLAALICVRPPHQPEGYVLVGPTDFERVMLLVPGSGGQAATLYALADELQRGLPARSAVAIVDLDAALYSAPHDDPLWFVSQRIVQVARDLGERHVMGIVGFSMGGALALRVADELGVSPAPPVWMLDTFAPRIAETGFWRKIERRIAWWLFGGRPETSESSSVSLTPVNHALPQSATPAQWHMLTEQLTEGTVAAPTARVRLIQARRSVKQYGLLWQRRNNGFVPQHYASWKVHEIDGAHLDLPRHLAATTARLIVDQGQFGASGAG
ncbi:MAG: amino acid adenylation domain-containing protein [Burkholderiales bacterium]